MVGEKILLTLLFSFALSQNCPKYSCSSSSDYCLEYTENSAIVSPCLVSPNTYCPFTAGINQTCTTPPSIPPLLLPGLSCSSNSSCLSGNCRRGHCSGQRRGHTCKQHEGYSINADCNAGLYCNLTQSPAVCLSLKDQYEPCTIDYECDYGSGCYSGICLKYRKIDIGDEIYAGYCIGGTSKFCEEEQCYIYTDGSAKCIEALETNGKINAFCTDSYGCQSKFNREIGGIVLGECQCGLNPSGTAFCANFLGDGYKKKYFKFLQDWGEGNDIEGCNIDAAFSPLCIRSRSGKSKYNTFLYYQFMANYQGMVKGAEKCVLKTLGPNYFLDSLQLHVEDQVMGFGMLFALAWGTILI